MPVSGPIGGLVWLARQIAENAVRQLLDPVRIETALLALERRLEAGEIDEATFEAEEAALLEELVDMRAASAAMRDGDEAAEPAAEPEAAANPPSDNQRAVGDGPVREITL